MGYSPGPGCFFFFPPAAKFSFFFSVLFPFPVPHPGTQCKKKISDFYFLPGPSRRGREDAIVFFRGGKGAGTYAR